MPHQLTVMCRFVACLREQNPHSEPHVKVPRSGAKVADLVFVVVVQAGDAPALKVVAKTQNDRQVRLAHDRLGNVATVPQAALD